MRTAAVTALSVGELLAEELRARRWTQQAFALMLGRPPQWVSEVITGKKALTPRAAAQVGAALGTSADLWLNMQARCALAVLDQDPAFQEELIKIRRTAKGLKAIVEGRHVG